MKLKKNEEGFCAPYRARMRKQSCLAYRRLKILSDGTWANNAKCKNCKGLEALENKERRLK